MKLKEIISTLMMCIILLSSISVKTTASEITVDDEKSMLKTDEITSGGSVAVSIKDEPLFFKSNLNENTISAFSATNSINSISNEYIEITLNSRSFALGTVEGNPELSTDNNKKLLFGYPNGGTSYTTIQIDGINNVFEPEATTCHVNSIISTDVIDDVIVTQYLNIVHNQYTNRDDVAEFFYTVENTGPVEHEIGIRIMFDTMLGSNDQAPFRIPNIGDVTTETDLSGDDVPEFWQAFDSMTAPSVIAQGTLNVDKDSTPDRVRFTNWSTASSNRWDYVRNTGSSNGDSAVCLYWNPRTVETNQVLSCKTYYGLSSLQQDNVPPLAVALSGATKLELTENESGVQSYTPNPFTVTAYIQNIGTGTAYNTNVELILPEGMTVVDGSDTIFLGDIGVNSKQTQVSWKVEVAPSSVDKTETYNVIVTADNAETKELKRQIEIPSISSIKESDIELLLDRNLIIDGNTLRLKFKIKNNGDDETQLSQLHPRYYLFDESPNVTTEFNCYSIQMNSPYSYVNNNVVAVEKVSLDTMYNMANSYYEFSFNTDEKILPHQEVVVDSCIHKTSWSDILSTNDYSYVGDNLVATDGYTIWKYMPIFSTDEQDSAIWGIPPVVSQNELEPDLLVEFDPAAVNGKGYMNLNIRITNKGLLPIDLGQTEIKYYYTNDCKLPQSVAGNYIGGRINNNFVGITDKAFIETVKMDVRKKMADTYVLIKFAEDTGILNFEDYVDLNIQVYNTNWKPGDYIIDNDYSYQDGSQEIQPFSLIANILNNTVGMRTTDKIIVNTAYANANISVGGFIDYMLGIEPEEYQPTFSIFKVGEGDTTANTLDDYYAAYRGFNEVLGARPYDYETATKENINRDLDFNNDNLKALLGADITYISGHGFDGGVIPIYSRARDEYGIRTYVNNYSKILSTDKNINGDYHTYTENNKNIVSVDNTYSVNMKDHANDGTTCNVKWMIISACSQLSEETTYIYGDKTISWNKSSLERWIDVLKNNTETKGILGYYGEAPAADNSWTPDAEVIEEFINKATDGNIYNAWLKANTKDWDLFKRRQNSGILVKVYNENKKEVDYSKESLKKSLSDNQIVKYDKIYLYKFASRSEIKNDVTNVYNINNLSTSINMVALANNYRILDDRDIITVTRDVFDENGNYLTTETVEHLVQASKIPTSEKTIDLKPYSVIDNSEILRIDASTFEVNVLK